MQLLINVAEETPASLMLAAHVLQMLATADMQNANGAALDTLAAIAPRRPTPPPPSTKPVHAPAAPAPLPPGADKPPAPPEHPPVHPDAETFVPPPPNGEPVAPDVPAGTPDPAAVFGPAVNPTVAGATAPAAPVAPLAGAPDAGKSVSTQTGPASSAGTAEPRDKRGWPWDKRIHSGATNDDGSHKMNADGTWRNARNLDPTVKAAVEAELAARYVPGMATAGDPLVNSVHTQVSLPQQPAAGVAGSVSVSAPPPPVPGADASAGAVPPPPSGVPAAGTVQVTPQPGGNAVPAGSAPDAPGPIPAAPNNVVSLHAGTPAVPVPPSTALGVSNTPDTVVVPAVSGFRDLMTKVNNALSAGRLSPAQLQEACKAIVGADSILALATQPAKVPEVYAHLRPYIEVAA